MYGIKRNEIHVISFLFSYSNKQMKKIHLMILSTLLFAAVVSGQADPKTLAPPVQAKGDPASSLATKALTAHGGEKLRGMRTLVIRGSVDITTSAFNQAIPATFAMVFAGEKYRFDLMNPIQPIKQVFDGKNTSTTIQNGFELPPINRQGFFMLSKIGDSGFPVTDVAPTSKKKNGFRITSPEGFYTDYFVDAKTGLISGYESSYDVNGRLVTTSVQIDKYRVVEGIQVPEKFAQRFDLGQFTAYADFKAKEISVNGAVPDEVFTLAN